MKCGPTRGSENERRGSNTVTFMYIMILYLRGMYLHIQLYHRIGDINDCMYTSYVHAYHVYNLLFYSPFV